MLQSSTRPPARTARRLAVLCVAAVAFLCSAASAYANGRYPKADQLVTAPDDGDFLAVRATFGVLVSRDAGKSWDWICERAIGYTGVQDPTLGLLEGGTLLASLSEGI